MPWTTRAQELHSRTIPCPCGADAVPRSARFSPFAPGACTANQSRLRRTSLQRPELLRVRLPASGVAAAQRRPSRIRAPRWSPAEFAQGRSRRKGLPFPNAPGTEILASPAVDTWPRRPTGPTDRSARRCSGPNSYEFAYLQAVSLRGCEIVGDCFLIVGQVFNLSGKKQRTG
jgi:hypothetical protein